MVCDREIKVGDRDQTIVKNIRLHSSVNTESGKKGDRLFLEIYLPVTYDEV